MKIEKLNDHQIRCTLTSEDLATRNIKLSELAYGSEKAKALFRDMMQQAAMDFYRLGTAADFMHRTILYILQMLLLQGERSHRSR